MKIKDKDVYYDNKDCFLSTGSLPERLPTVSMPRPKLPKEEFYLLLDDYDVSIRITYVWTSQIDAPIEAQGYLSFADSVDTCHFINYRTKSKYQTSWTNGSGRMYTCAHAARKTAAEAKQAVLEMVDDEVRALLGSIRKFRTAAIKLREAEIAAVAGYKP